MPKQKKKSPAAPAHPINVFFCGIGGQGVLTAAEICGCAALRDGYHVKKSEVHGMAQRGGSVESHLRFGRAVASPLIPCGQVDYFVSFHPDEQARFKHLLKPGGVDCSRYLARASQFIPDKRFLNTFMLGVLAAYLPIREQSWLDVLEEAFAGKYAEENKTIFITGKRVCHDME